MLENRARRFSGLFSCLNPCAAAGRPTAMTSAKAQSAAVRAILILSLLFPLALRRQDPVFIADAFILRLFDLYFLRTHEIVGFFLGVEQSGDEILARERIAAHHFPFARGLHCGAFESDCALPISFWTLSRRAKAGL